LVRDLRFDKALLSEVEGLTANGNFTLGVHFRSAADVGHFHLAAAGQGGGGGADLGIAVVAVAPDGPGVTLVTLPFRRDWLLVAVNESGSTRRLRLSRPGRPETLRLEAPAGRANMAFVDPRQWTVVDSLEPLP